MTPSTLKQGAPSNGQTLACPQCGSVRTRSLPLVHSAVKHGKGAPASAGIAVDLAALPAPVRRRLAPPVPRNNVLMKAGFLLVLFLSATFSLMVIAPFVVISFFRFEAESGVLSGYSDAQNLAPAAVLVVVLVYTLRWIWIKSTKALLDEQR